MEKRALNVEKFIATLIFLRESNSLFSLTMISFPRLQFINHFVLKHKRDIISDYWKNPKIAAYSNGPW